ncbi:hypothetical protein [Cryptosporangium sp. NPDC048952]|uniref:hypothetical protein n=1 Tax=Cryptosporangium sp. NPDC048952 TaxID=3363961 RepID=UPI0037233D63
MKWRRRKPTPPVGTPFQPAVSDEATDYAWVVEQVARIAPKAVDEGTGSVLDALIDHRTKERCEQIERKYAQYVATLPTANLDAHAHAAEHAALADLYATENPA